MVNRRSIGDAMTLNPDKLAFIKGNAAEATPQTGSAAVSVAQEASSTDEHDASAPRRRTRSKNQLNDEPKPSEILDRMLVPVTLRLQHRTAQALKRAALEQKLKHKKPNQVQEIGEEAITHWLEKNSYLE